MWTAGGVLKYASANVVPEKDCTFPHDDETEMCVVDEHTGTCYVSFDLLILKVCISYY